jgi:xanthine dehydrogenase molybdenum-binding subunit
MTAVGASPPRLEAPAKASGRARYVADLVQPGMLHGRLVRSPYPHARVLAVDTAEALATPGVVTIVSSIDIASRLPGLAPFDLACGSMERDPDAEPLPGDATLLGSTVRYVGDPVALVLAESEAAASRAAALVNVDYEPLDALLTPADAQAEGAVLLHEGAVGNVATRKTRRLGDPERAFADAAVVVERTFVTSRQKQAQLEPTGALAMVDSDGRITVWTPHQAPHRARYTLARLFGIPAARIRVIVPTVGGAFGKNDALTAEPYAICGALLTGRPVRVGYTRQEDFVGTEARHATETTMAMALRSDGTIAGVRGRSIVDAGAYLSHSAAITAVMLTHMVASYRIEHAELEATCLFTNTPVNGAFRGYGGPQASFPVEHLIDVGCAELGVDPLQARLRMRLRPGDPWGYRDQEITGDGHRLCLEEGAKAFGWDRARAPHPSAPGKVRGAGMASTVWKSGIVGKGMDHSAATARMTPDGGVLLLTAAADLGTGIRTTLAQICADAIGLPLDQITVVDNDTDLTPYDTGAFASRTLYRAGQAVEAAGSELRDRVLAFAGSSLEIDVADLVLTAAGVEPRGSPDRRISLPKLLRDGYLAGHEFVGHGQAPQTTAPSFCAVFAEVVVDCDTGQVSVLRVLAAQDVGRAINPAIVEGQIQGAVHQGIGLALTEGLVLDPETGTLLNGTYMDYRLLTSADSPRIEVLLVEEPDPTGPSGARGVGEPGIVVAAPAIANAILHATGTAPTRLPLTPERVLEALRSDSSQSRGA